MIRPGCGEESPTVMALIAILSTAMLLCSCVGYESSPYPRATPASTIEQLLIEQSMLPDDWQVWAGTFEPRQWLPAEQIALSFGIDGCAPNSLGGSHYVYRFPNGARSVASAYRYKTTIWFAATEGWGPWDVPPQLVHKSPLADQYRFDCTIRLGSTVQTCQAVGQYEECLVRFHTSMDAKHPECMSFVDLERILIAIDERVALYLGKETQ